jgi:competence protein ComEA
MGWWGRDGDGERADDGAESVARQRLARVVGESDGVMAVDPWRAGTATAWPVRDADDPAVDPVRARRALAAFDPGRRGIRVLALVVAFVATVVAVVVWWHRPRPEPVPSLAVPDAAVSAASGTGAPGSRPEIVVSVTGRVQRPGLVRLPFGSRVADAIEATGGVLPGTDLSSLNLARRLVDGELLAGGVSPPPGAAAPGAGGAGAAAGGPLNLNTATLTELDALPGVGPVLAQRILDYRAKSGGFRTVDELRKVEGLGEARYAQLKDLVTV